MDLTNILQVASNSDVGRKREHNEDSSAIDPACGLMIIADGMGGYKAGEVASAIATSSIVNHIHNEHPNISLSEIAPASQFTNASHMLNNAIIQANYEVYRNARDHHEYSGMGTTVVVLILYDNYFSVAHVGDSRLYRLRDDEFKKITNDHSLAQELVDRGFCSHQEAQIKTPSNLVTRALGISESVSVDVFEDSVLPDDLFLLCTDGLTDMVNDTEIHLTLQKFSGNLNRAAQELVDLANERGGRDNISVILARPLVPFAGRGSWLTRLLRNRSRKKKWLNSF